MLRQFFEGLRGGADFGDLDNAIKGQPGGMRAQHLASAAAEHLVAVEVLSGAELTSDSSRQPNGQYSNVWTELPAEGALRFLQKG
jgi:hypothetical protein